MKFTMLGSANHAGPVRLSDTYSSSVGAAADGIAASQKALYDAYTSLNSRMILVNSKIPNPLTLNSGVLMVSGDYSNYFLVSYYVQFGGAAYTWYSNSVISEVLISETTGIKVVFKTDAVKGWNMYFLLHKKS